MDFFGRQARTRRLSRWLVVAFAITMAVSVLSIHLVIAGIYDHWQRGPGGEGEFRAIVILVLIYAAMLLGGLFRYLDFRAGGACMARRFGAVQASDRERRDHEKRLLQVVAEMAIAAGHPAPDVYVMRDQRSINAFVVGHAKIGYALVVTEGALKTLDRDELQAVVAHEFAHLVHGDVRLNMFMLIVLGGLLALEEIGQKLCGFNPTTRRESALAGVLVGSVVRMLGLPGLIAGRILQAAVTRQREYLADATAVQFTRYPEALASALDTIERNHELSGLRSTYAAELAHMCFHDGALRARFERWLATHPTLEQRIDAVYPGFDRRRRRSIPPDRLDWRSQPQVSSRALQAAGALAMVGCSVDIGGLIGQGRRDSPVSARSARDQPKKLEPVVGSDRMELLLGSPGERLAALFALLASVHPAGRPTFVSRVGFAHGARFQKRVTQIGESLADDIREQPQAMITWLCEHLQADMDHDRRQRLMGSLEQLALTDGNFSILQYATLQVIRRQLDVEFPLLESVAEQGGSLAHRRRVKSFEAMGEEFALLLSLLIESSGAPDSEQDALFNRTLRCYTRNVFPRRTGRESGLQHDLESAFQTLYAQPRLVREAFVRHCQEIALHDGRVEVAESAILALFSTALDCTTQAQAQASQAA